jgi:PHD/YefM family antitoxin component YafN of YafNO toxin-antitoxin module
MLAVRSALARGIATRSLTTTRHEASRRFVCSLADDQRQHQILFFFLIAVVGGGSSVTLMETGAKAPPTKMAKRKDVTCLPHGDVTILRKQGRYIVLMGALNYARESSELAASLVQQVKPQAVFLDINERVFTDFGIDKRVEEGRKPISLSRCEEGVPPRESHDRHIRRTIGDIEQ